jgi:hypothetical protein
LSSARVFGTPNRFITAWPVLLKIWRRKGLTTAGSLSMWMPSRRRSISSSEKRKYGL